MTRFLIVCATLLVAVPLRAADAPYKQAVEIVRAIHKGPDEALIDRDAPLDARTAKFLTTNEKIFALLHEAAVNDQPEWTDTTDDMQALLNDMNPLRSLANVGLLRARWLMQQNQPMQAVDQIVDVMVLGRNVDRFRPVLVASMVSVGIGEAAMSQLAEILPTLPRDVLTTLPDRLKQLPPTIAFADLMRGEQQFGGGMLAKQMNGAAGAKTFDAMSPFYEAVRKASEESPPLSSEEFKKKATEAIGAIEKDQQVSKMLAQTLVSSFSAFYGTYNIHRAHRAMLDAAIVVARDGDDAVKSSTDPFGDGPFQFARRANGFELTSKWVDRSGKPVTMRFGK
jgi:hypothetical protein